MERKGAKPWNKERTKKGGCRLHMAWAAKPARHGWEPGRGGSLWRPSGTLAFALTPCVTDRMALGCDWAKPTATTGNDSASGNWRRKSAPCVSSRENKRRLLIFKNPWASCRNHSRNISLRAGITPPWSHCGAGMPAPGDLVASPPLYPGTEEPDAQAEIGGTAPKTCCSGSGLPLSPALAGIRLLPQACPPADAACWYLSCRACKATTNSRHSHPIASNLLKRNFF